MAATNEILAELAVQFWKLCEAFEREIAGGDGASAEAAGAQLRFARRRLDILLDGAGLGLRTYDGERWDASLPPSPLNAEEIGDAAAAAVDRTIEPTILAGSQVLLPGKVMLKDA
jgi:hypothetical protein